MTYHPGDTHTKNLNKLLSSHRAPGGTRTAPDRLPPQEQPRSALCNVDRLLGVLATLAVASGCSFPDDKAPPSSPSSSASAHGAREAVEAYVTALNSRSITEPIAVGGVKDAKWSRQEATQILADRGGRGWKIKDVQTEHDLGPDTGSARLVAEDKAGKPLQDTFTETRQKGTWHLVVFTHQPTEPGKEPASTDKPGS